MGVATGCGCKEVYRFFLILLIPTPLVSVLFCSSIPTFCSFLKCFSSIYMSEREFYIHLHYCANSLSWLHLCVAHLYLHCRISHWADI